MNILAIALTAQLGHIEFNKKLLRILNESFDVTFLSSDKYVKKIEFNKSITISDNLFEYSNKYEFVIKQIKLIRYIRNKYIVNSKYDKIVILDFENISFALTWRNINIPTYNLIHNNLTRGKLSSFFFKQIKNNVTHIVLEKYIEKELSQKLKNKIYYIPHPINNNVAKLRQKLNDHKIQEGLIFCPSSSSSKDDINDFIDFVRTQKKYKFVAKGNNVLNEDMVTVKPFFDNYEELLLKCEYVFIPFKYNYRVSGIFYDAMTLHKKILTSQNSGKFMIEMAKKYPKTVVVLNNYLQIENIDINNNKNEYYDFFLEHSNNIIADKFKNILE